MLSFITKHVGRTKSYQYIVWELYFKSAVHRRGSKLSYSNGFSGDLICSRWPSNLYIKMYTWVILIDWLKREKLNNGCRMIRKAVWCNSRCLRWQLTDKRVQSWLYKRHAHTQKSLQSSSQKSRNYSDSRKWRYLSPSERQPHPSSLGVGCRCLLDLVVTL